MREGLQNEGCDVRSRKGVKDTPELLEEDAISSGLSRKANSAVPMSFAGARGVFPVERRQVVTNSASGASSSRGRMLTTFMVPMGSSRTSRCRLEFMA